MKKIRLSKDKFALVDDEDFEWLSQWKWHIKKNESGKFYAIRYQYLDYLETTKRIFMHRIILKASNLVKIDHWDGNGLNNQRYNLRFATTSQNAMNRGKQKNNKSGYKGVCWSTNKNKWQTSIALNSKNIWIGRFSNIIEAAKAYDQKALELFGEFAVLNFPNSER